MCIDTTIMAIPQPYRTIVSGVVHSDLCNIPRGLYNGLNSRLGARIVIAALGAFAWYAGYATALPLVCAGVILCPQAALVGVGTALAVKGISLVVAGVSAKALVTVATGCFYYVAAWSLLEQFPNVKQIFFDGM